MDNTGIWLSILDYAQFKGTSISTIRRYIKGGRLKTKVEEGKYFICVPAERYQKKNEEGKSVDEREHLSLRLENERYKMQVRQLQEEILDLKTLLHVYESPKIFELPPLPLE
jgi:predicted site-specific integrase-resolvase